MSSKSVTLYVENLLTRVVAEDVSVHHLLNEKMAIMVNGAWFSQLYKDGKWDGRIRFYKLKTQTFETGLLHKVVTILRSEGYAPSIKFIRKKPRSLYEGEFTRDMLRTPLREYQCEAVDIAKKCTRGILALPTGSGKTEIAMAIINELRVPTIFVVNSVDLLYQTSKRFMDTIPRIHVTALGDSKIQTYGNPRDLNVVVSTFQTLHKKPNLIWNRRFNMKISDECHGVAAKTWREVMYTIDAYYSFGLSGSIDQYYEDNVRYHEIMGSTGRPIVVITPEQLVDQGYLVKPEIVMVKYTPKIKAISRRKTASWGYADVYLNEVVNDDYLNGKLIPNLLYLHVRKRQKCLILVNRVEHGKRLISLLERKNVKSRWVYGADPAAKRLEAIVALRSGSINVLVASKIFNQGVDIPEIDVIINIGCDDSYRNVFQKLGRGLRIAKGKDTFRYYDIWPMDNHYLEAAAEGRVSKYKYLGFQPTEITL